MSRESHEVAIIGAGPIGIEIAVALKKAGIDYLHFDARQIGYTVSWFAPQTRFFSSNERIAIAGVPLFTPDQTKCTREQYLAYLRAVVVQFDLKINTYERVINIERGGAGASSEFLLTTRRANSDQKYSCRKLILATGGTERPRRLNIPGEDLPHVSHYFQDPHDFFQKKLLIVGGKNSAVEAALRSHHCGANVAISYRRAEFNPTSIKYWLQPEINGYIKSAKIAAYFNTTVREIHPGGAVLAGVDGHTTKVDADFVLLLIGYESDMTLCKLAGVELKPPSNVPMYDPLTMQTNVPGLYIAGTAIGGTQEKYTVFIENCHIHADRILASLIGSAPPDAPAPVDRPES
jgi:thioredoxin reductase (NADPH)